LQPVVAHPDRVSVRKSEAKLATQRPVVFDDNVPFATDVLAGRLDPRPNLGFQSSASVVSDHVKIALKKHSGPTRGGVPPGRHPVAW
jgi:hypothetical protein